MSELAAAQIPKPNDEQAFERANEVLWQKMLNDPTAKLFARRGQAQNGVDIVGIIEGDPNKVVGIQCKLKSEHQKLTADEVRSEVEKAKGFRPALCRYVIVTTSPDDAALTRLALELSQELSRGRGTPFIVEIMGWQTLERAIRRYPEALHAFDPSHTVHGDRLVAQGQEQQRILLDHILPKLNTIENATTKLSVESLSAEGEILSQLDAEIDRYAKLISTAPSTAYSLFEGLQASLSKKASGRIRFRVRANLAACQLELGNVDQAITGFLEAFDFDPDNPKAIANKGAAYLLAGELGELKQFAVENLRKDPENSILAGHLVQGLAQDQKADSPLDNVPAAIRSSKEVTIAMVRWHSQRSDADQWFMAAKDAFERFGNDQDLGELYAAAVLNVVVGDQGLVFGRNLTPEELTLCRDARQILQEHWKTVKNPANHVRGEPISLPLNLSLLHRILGHDDDALIVANEALVRFPNNDEIRIRVAAIYSETGQHARALELVEGLVLDKLTAQIRFSASLSLKKWREVVDLAERHLKLFPEQDQMPVKAAGLVARVYLAKPDERVKILNDGIERFKGDTRAAVMLSKAAERFGLEPLSDNFFAMAVEAFDGEPENYAARVTLARAAFDRAEWSSCVELLFDRVNRETNSEELRLLANALCNEYPVRQRGVEFFRSLPDAILSEHYFTRAKGISLTNQGRGFEAIPLFDKAFEQSQNIGDFLLLIQAHLINDDKKSVQKLLSKNEPLHLIGSPLEKLNLCHVLAAFQHYKGVMEHAYAAVCASPDDADVAMRFCGLVVNPAHKWSEISIEGEGRWIKLERDNGENFEALVDEKIDRLWGKNISSENRFIRAFEGRSEDGSFEFETQIGAVEKWKLVETKPNWVRAFQYLSDNYQRLFPDQTGIGSISMEDGDIQPALDMVRRTSEAVERQARLHIDNGVPLTFIAGKQHGGTIAIADYLAQIGERLRTCVGSQEERDHAIKLIRENKKHGVVIDALTAWRAAELGLLEVLVDQLGKLLIPQSELDVIKQVLADREMDSDGDSMTMTYHDGKFFRDIKSVEERAKQTLEIKRTVQEIEKTCTAMPVVFPNELAGGMSDLLRMPNAIGLAPAALAGSEYLLLSDDMTLRQLAGEAFKTEGIWLQAVLMEARRERIISDDGYLAAVVMLAAYRHDYISVSSDDLSAVFSRDASENLLEFRTLCEFIGGRDADPISHLTMSASFINRIWGSAKWGETRHQKATSILLEHLLLRFRGRKWSLWAAYLVMLLSPDANVYVERWVRGHFLPSDEVQAAINQIAEVSSGRRSLDP